MKMTHTKTSHIFPRHTKAEYPTAVGGQGCYLFDSRGKQYFDGSGGAAVSCLGHGDQEIIEAAKSQMDKLAFAHTGFFTSEPAEELAHLLIENAPEGLDRVYIVSGGSEAMESAIKLARQYFVEIGMPSKSRVIARRQSYHGNTLGALAAGGNEWRRRTYQPLLAPMSHISPCYAYRGKLDSETPIEYGERIAQELRQEIEAIGPENVMAFIAEPVVGATLGAVPAVDGYFAKIREICDAYDVLLILDEVMCGTGRTGSLFAFEQEGVVPDIMAMAKGLGAGYMPIAAMLCSRKIYSAIEEGSGFFQHGHTYLGHPVAAAAGTAVLKAILERNLIERVRDMGSKLDAELKTAFGQHPHVGDIRGRGLFRGIELVANRATKEPFDPNLGVNKKIKKHAFEAGLICYPMGGTLDGTAGDHILLAPPFIMEDHHVDEIVSKITMAIEKAI